MTHEFTCSADLQFLKGTGCLTVAEAIVDGVRTHDQWLNVVEAFQALEQSAKAKEQRASSALTNVRKLYGAQFQVLQQLEAGDATYPELHNSSRLSASSTHKAVMVLLKSKAISYTGSLSSRKHRAVFSLTTEGQQLLEQYQNSFQSGQNIK